MFPRAPTFLRFAAAVVVGLAGVLWVLISSTRWQETTGTITRSEVVQEPNPRASSPSSDFRYRALVEYTYEAQGQHRTGDVIVAGLNAIYDNSATAHDMVDQFPVGKTVPVYVHPDDPSRAALITAAAIPLRAVIALAAIAVVVLLTAAWVLARFQKPPA